MVLIKWLKYSSIFVSLLLAGCITNVWTGATLLYDRHNLYLKIDDAQLAGRANHAIYRDKTFKRNDCIIEVAIFNGDVLLLGQVPTEELRSIATERIANIPKIRRFFNQLIVGDAKIDTILDSFITAKIRSRIFADSSIDPHQFKVITFNQIVYLMGDVIPQQANIVILMARQTNSVLRVVKLFKYYNLSDKPE